MKMGQKIKKSKGLESTIDKLKRTRPSKKFKVGCVVSVRPNAIYGYNRLFDARIRHGDIGVLERFIPITRSWGVRFWRDLRRKEQFICSCKGKKYFQPRDMAYFHEGDLVVHLDPNGREI